MIDGRVRTVWAKGDSAPLQEYFDDSGDAYGYNYGGIWGDGVYKIIVPFRPSAIIVSPVRVYSTAFVATSYEYGTYSYGYDYPSAGDDVIIRRDDVTPYEDMGDGTYAVRVLYYNIPGRIQFDLCVW